MKLIDKLEERDETSLYSGQVSHNYEMYLRPAPKTDENGKPLKAAQRYYVFRLLFFTSDDRKNYPYIVRNEHVFYKKDFSGNIKEVKRICCPTTPWARSKIQDTVDKDYCPICKFSFEQKSEGFKNFRTLKQVDKICLEASRNSERVWAAYMPVLVVSDPNRSANNNHFRILRLSGKEGKRTFDMIEAERKRIQNKGLTVFNGGEGVNIAILCEKCEVVATNNKGEPVIDKETGEPRTYMANCVTDVRALEKRLHSYDIVTEANLEQLRFDETYGVPSIATKDQLSMFLSENYLANGATDEDFGEDEFSDSGENDTPINIAKSATVNETEVSNGELEEDEEDNSKNPTDIAETEDEQDEDEDDFENESPRDAIARITRGRISTEAAPQANAVAKKASSKKVSLQSSVKDTSDVETMRDSSLDIDPDDLPF